MYKSRYLILLVIVLVTVGGGWLYVQRRAIPQEMTIDFAQPTKGENTAIFAAYSADGTISGYVIDYLKKLKEIAPNIIFITDNPIPAAETEKLRPYVVRIEAGRHGEYDWGSYKRGYNWLKEKGLMKADGGLLILANDSALAVAPSLLPVLKAAEESGADVFGITANQDGFYHLQSYFLIFTPRVYTAPEFDAYLNVVKPEKDGLTVAYRYEVPFTGYLEQLGFSHASLIPYKELAYLPLNDKNCYPLTMLSKYHTPLLKMRTFTERLNVQEPRRLVFNWLKKNAPEAYRLLLIHLEKIKSPYLKEAR